MLIRPTRSIVFLLALFGLFATVSFLDGKLKSYSKNRFSIITAPVHQATPPPSQIVEFWDQVAGLFDKTRPKINQPIRLAGKLDGISLQGDQADGDRKPFPKTIRVSEKDVQLLAQSHLHLITSPYLDQANERASENFKGTGVVTVAGGEYFAPAILSIRMLRKTNSTLPVQVFLQSRNEYDREICEDVLQALNAQCFIIQDHLRSTNPFQVTDHQLKVLAILLSSFRKVLFLDSDCMALRDPQELFETNPFKSTGLLSWSDYWIATEDPTFYRIAGLAKFPAGMPALSSETGQLMVDKTKHLSTLLLAAYYNMFGPECFYPLLNQAAMGEGDKETYLAAATILKNPYYRIKERVGTVGYHDKAGEFHGAAMVQYHAADEWNRLHGNATEKENVGGTKARPFFLHANSPTMDVAHVLDDKATFLPGTEHRIRIWGPQESIVEMFEYDVEKVVWDEMRLMACELDNVLEDWKGRWKLCKRATDHYKELFDGSIARVPEDR